ncbi:MAG: glycosyltransferase family 4 protein [Candidatus Obscuribacterales bacterium]|nr:glycosyltransferase family 4 protein [Candidatus Obscuribacterales bacterium]
MKIALTGWDIGINWIGGRYYFQNLLQSLCRLDESCKPKLTLVAQSELEPSDTAFFNSINATIVQWREPGISKFIGKLKSRIGIFSFLESGPATYLNSNRFDVVFSPSPPVPGCKVPCITWIADFQHVHLPDMFTSAELQARDESFQRAARTASCILLSSNSALTDFVAFAPQWQHKAQVMHFSADIPPDVYKRNPREIALKYKLPERFLYLPNQFWKHKNHLVVVESLRLLKAAGKKVTVVCTGHPSDYRNPEFFSSLLGEISQKGVRESFLLLGLVPRADAYDLMRQSIAIIQPSLFEGWSSTVEEAKSIGKRVALSDIPVHREQDPPASIFFNPSDSEGLAAILDELNESISPGPDLELEEAARAVLPSRIQQQSARFMEIANYASAQFIG